MKKFIIITLITLACIVGIQDILNNIREKKQPNPSNYIVMLSLDGFRYNYTDKCYTPTLNFIADNGVKASGLQASFPTKTFPNHYTIATGLYPGNHEIVENSFYAEDLNKCYDIHKNEAVTNSDFYKGEPMWVTASSQKLTTACYFWVGSETKIKGYYPNIYKKYDRKITYMQRIDSVISWLSLPYNKRPRLINWYFAQPDKYGHKYGPNSNEVKNEVEIIDSLLMVFLNKTKQLDIKDSINFIIVSDHGMSQTDPKKVVFLEDYINKNWIDTITGSNPSYYIYAKKKYKDSVYNNLKKEKHISVWKQEKLPERFCLKQSNRIGDIVVVADSSWSLLLNKKTKLLKGIHGYDNLNKEMDGIFYAIGPDFKTNYNAGQIYNVDIYNLVMKLLNLKPAPNDGNLERITHTLKVKK